MYTKLKHNINIIEYSGPRGLLRLQGDLSRPENKGLQFAMD